MKPADKAGNNEVEAKSQDAGQQPGRSKQAAKMGRRLLARGADTMPVVEAVDGPVLQRDVLAELVEPSPRGGLREVFQQRYVLRLIVSRQLAQQYAASLLGLMWSYVQPAMRFTVYYIVFGFVLKLHQGTPFFAIHLFTGIVVVHYFGETWNGGTRSIWSNRGLVKKMRMPREIFPVAAMLVAAYHTVPQLLLLVLFCLITGWNFSWTALAAGVLGLALLVIFAMTLALFFSAVNVFARDFQNIVQTFLQFMHFMVPMMYSFDRIWAAHNSHPVIYQLYVSNPVAQAVLLLQRFFWYPLIEDTSKLKRQFPPDLFERGLITLAISLVLLWLAQKYFSRVEGKFAERL